MDSNLLRLDNMDSNLLRLDNGNTRRVFLQKALSTAGICLSAGAVATILTSCEKDETLPTPPVEPIKLKISDHPRLTGAGTIAQAIVTGLNNGESLFISQVGSETFAVFSSTCTHAGCKVNLPVSSGEDCVCPCHGSRYFPTDGRVKQGPAPASLKSFASTYNSATGILSVMP